MTMLSCIAYLVKNWPTKPGKIAESLGINRVAVHKFLNEGITHWYITKSWNTPHVLYDVTQLVDDHYLLWWDVDPIKSNVVRTMENYDDLLLLKTFYKFASDGTILQWKAWLDDRAKMRNLDPQQSAQAFCDIVRRVHEIQTRCWCIDMTSIFRQTLEKKHNQSSSIDHLLYADRYLYDQFGRWPLAEMAFFAKMSQNITLIWDVIDRIMDRLDCIIHQFSIDAIAITPRSIDRNIQLLWELHKRCVSFGLPFVQMSKFYPAGIPVAQKTLKWLQRFINAMRTIQVTPWPCYKNILLIDDFVWSWATLNISAMKCKAVGVADTVIGFAMVGNIDMSFDVINEI